MVVLSVSPEMTLEEVTRAAAKILFKHNRDLLWELNLHQ